MSNRYSVTITHKPTGITAKATAGRSLVENKRLAMGLLKARLRAAGHGNGDTIRTYDLTPGIDWIKDARSGQRFAQAERALEQPEVAERVIAAGIRSAALAAAPKGEEDAR